MWLNNSDDSSSLLSEVFRLLWLAISIQFLLSLLSYSPTDPSWTTYTSFGTSSAHHLHNWMGRTGSVLADVLFQIFGLSSFALVLVLGLFGLRQVELPRGYTWKTALLRPILFTLSMSALLQCTYPKKWMPFQLRNPGGLSGSFLKSALTYASGEVGAVLFSVCFFLAMTILLFRWRLVTWFIDWIHETLPSVWTKVKRFPADTMSSLKTTLANRKAALPAKAEPEPSAISIPAPVTPTTVVAAPAPAKKVKTPPPPAAEAKNTEEDIDDGDSPIPIRRAKSEDEEIFKIMTPKARSVKEPEAAKPVKRGNRDYQLPPLSLLSGRTEAKSKPIDKNWYYEKGQILVQKLKDFGVEGEVVQVSAGPVITVYEFKPASGVKIKEIANLSDDLTLALSVLSVRIVAPIPGKPVVGIEIPTPSRETVFFKDILQETNFYDAENRIPIVLGRLASGDAVVAGLAQMPHLLVAGSTGTGKSVFINTLISSLLYRYTPQQLKLILVDPKMVELASYEGIPHLMLPVVVDSKKAALALRWTVDEMERRYTLMHQMGVRHLDAYNQKVGELKMNAPAKKKEDGEPGQKAVAPSAEPQNEEPQFLPYIVVVVDEYADLMAVVPKDVELSIARLAQKARASGIHLVLATQRPSTDVVTGTIKANFPSRISFRVASGIDSKTILDRTGAERLLGAGDMLFHSAGFTSLKRMQGAFISDGDLEKVVSFLKAQGEPEYDERILRYQEEMGEEDGGDGEGGDENEGNLYDRAVRLVAEKGEASISLIQRHLKIGYNRAATLMEQMEKEGVVAQATGVSKRRQVLITPQ